MYTHISLYISKDFLVAQRICLHYSSKDFLRLVERMNKIKFFNN